MSTITGYSASAYGATASMLRNTAAAADTKPGSDAPSASAAKAPKDSIELSDTAKATLARAQTERVAAAKLQKLVAEVILNGKGKATDKPSVKHNADDGMALFTALTGKSSALNGSDAPKSLSDIDPANISEYMDALMAAHKRADGTTEAFSVRAHDAIKVPSTPEELEEWFQTNGQYYVEGARQVNDPEYNIMAQAIQNRTLKVQNAMDIPGLNFHNTIIFETGAVGASVNGSFAYNRDADIFKDPMMNYIVNSDGTVLSWKKDPIT